MTLYKLAGLPERASDADPQCNVFYPTYDRSKCDQVGDNSIQVHPVLLALRAFQRPTGEFDFRCKGVNRNMEWLAAMQESAAEPALCHATIRVTDYSSSRDYLCTGASVINLHAPVTVRQVLMSLRYSLQQRYEESHITVMRDKTKYRRRSAPLQGPRTVDLRLTVSEEGTFRFEVELKVEP